MSQFYADIQGNRSERTCTGTKSSGLTGHIRGWNIGARVEVSYNADLDRDEVRVSLTGGSNRSTLDRNLGCWYRDGDLFTGLVE